MEQIHLIGIGGTGLSAIARVLHERGYLVSGSDQQLTPMVEMLQSLGINVEIGHRPENVNGATLVIRSSAVPDDNVELVAAVERGIPVLKRSDFLKTLTDGYQVIAVAGSHGKTTTTSMIIWCLSELGQNPSFIVGGLVANLGTNARSGTGPYFVIEADEYDHMFLGLEPDFAVITNVEWDHPDFFPTPEDFHRAFYEYVKCIPTGGLLLACGDDLGATELLLQATRLDRKAFSFGLGSGNDFQAQNLAPDRAEGYSFDVVYRGEMLGSVSLKVPGIHNVFNALAAVAVGHSLGLPIKKIARSLGKFQGAKRRFELRGEEAGITLIDDYAHHPTEIKATLAAARSRYPQRRLWAIWQPHTYSRTISLWQEFSLAFEGADQVIVTSVYAARESPPVDFSMFELAKNISHPNVQYIPELREVIRFLYQNARREDVVLVLSAGDANQICEELLELLKLVELRQ